MGRRLRRMRVAFRKALRRVIYSRGSSQSIAGGAALGVFVGLSPTVGFQMIISAVLATVFRLNRLAAILPVWITNPVTIPPIYYFEFVVGSWIVPYGGGAQVMDKFHAVSGKIAEVSLADFWATTAAAFSAMGQLGAEILVPLIVGSLICGVVAAAVTYPVALWTVNRVRAKRMAYSAHKAQLRMERLEAEGLINHASEHAGERSKADGPEVDGKRAGEDGREQA